MKLPFAVIDIEASALSLSTWPELSSYPVEVGVAVVHARDAVSSWSSLIKPDPAWAKYGDWDAGWARIHKLTRDMLRDGQSAATAAAALNTLLAPLGRVYCDGGRYDAHWLHVLHATAGIPPAYTLADVSALLSNAAMRARYAAQLALTTAPHRAGPDALRIAHALLAAQSA